MKTKSMPTILLVSFGTVDRATRQKSIDAVAETLQQAYPNYALRQAFTSSIVIRRLAQQGILVDDVPSALEKLKQTNCQQLYILPTHLFPGEEYHKLLTQIEPYRKDFSTLSVAKPLLSEEQDWTHLSDFLQKAYPSASGEALLLMAHGSEHNLSNCYLAMTFLLQKHCPYIFLAAMEGEPSLDNVLNEIYVQAYHKVKLLPLMLSAGTHAVKDMAGEQENSWKNRCLSAGFDVECILSGLGEAEEIRQLYLLHLQGVIDE